MNEKKELKSYGEELKKEIVTENMKKIEGVHAIKEGAMKAKDSVIKSKSKNGKSPSNLNIATLIMTEKRKLQKQIQMQKMHIYTKI